MDSRELEGHKPGQPCDRREFLHRTAAWAAGAMIPHDPGTSEDHRPDLLDARFRQLLALQGPALVYPPWCSFREFALVGPGGRDDGHRELEECLFVDLPPSGFCLGVYDFDPPSGWRRAAFALGFRPKEQVTPELCRPDYLALGLPTADETMAVAARFFRLVGEGPSPVSRPSALLDEELLALAASLEEAHPGRLRASSNPFQGLLVFLGHQLCCRLFRTGSGWLLHLELCGAAGRTVGATRKRVQGALALGTGTTAELREYDEAPSEYTPGIHVFECRLKTAAEVLALIDRLLLA